MEMGISIISFIMGNPLPHPSYQIRKYYKTLRKNINLGPIFSTVIVPVFLLTGSGATGRSEGVFQDSHGT